MYKDFNTLDENRLDAEIDFRKKNGRAGARGKTSVICLTVAATMLVVGYSVYKIVTQDFKHISFSTLIRTPIWEWHMIFDYESGSKDSAADPKEPEDMSDQEPRLPTVTVTADQSCWIYEQPDSDSKQISYAETDDVLQLIDIVYIDGVPYFYKVGCIDKYDNKTFKIGYMNSDWGKVTPA